MLNRKMSVGLLTILGTGIAIVLMLTSKKGRRAGRDFLMKGRQMTGNLKGRFADFRDRADEKVHSIIN